LVAPRSLRMDSGLLQLPPLSVTGLRRVYVVGVFVMEIFSPFRRSTYLATQSSPAEPWDFEEVYESGTLGSLFPLLE